MTAPIRIRTASGEEISLANLRQQAGKKEGNWYATQLVNVLDALEAALGVPREKFDGERIGLYQTHDDGHDHALEKVRQAAGVIEEGGA